MPKECPPLPYQKKTHTDRHTAKSSSWSQKDVMISKVCHDVKMFVIKSKNTPWRQQVRHDIKNTSWHQTVLHDLKTFAMISKTYHDVKSSPWRRQVRHDVKNMSWWQKIRHYFEKVLPNVKKTSWCFLIKSKTRHDVKSSSWCQNRSWRQKVRRDIKNTAWRQKACHDVNSLSWSQ